jgi:hypothetical protein
MGASVVHVRNDGDRTKSSYDFSGSQGRLTAGFRLTACAIFVAVFLLQQNAAAQNVPRAPQIAIRQIGATVEAVTIETYGVIKPNAVWPYLLLHKGSRLDQPALDGDFNNLVTLGGYRVRLNIAQGRTTNTVTLHWIVMYPWFRISQRSVYAEMPLANRTGGISTIIASPQLGNSASRVTVQAAFNLFTRHYSAGYDSPIHVNPNAGRQTEFIVNYFGEQNILRLNTPVAVTTYDWTAGTQALFLLRSAGGTQFEIGLRQERSTGRVPTGIIAPSLYPINRGPARNTLAEVGLSHACSGYPPQCNIQYRLEFIDGIGGLGSTTRLQAYVTDVARYIPVHTSTLALHALELRTGGIIPESRLACAFGLRAYTIAFCGTDAQVFQAEYRIRDATFQKLKFVVFTETGATRVRGGNQPWATPNFQWHADSGVGIRYRGVALDLGYGSTGYRLTLGLLGQTF